MSVSESDSVSEEVKLMSVHVESMIVHVRAYRNVCVGEYSCVSAQVYYRACENL